MIEYGIVFNQLRQRWYRIVHSNSMSLPEYSALASMIAVARTLEGKGVVWSSVHSFTQLILSLPRSCSVLWMSLLLEEVRNRPHLDFWLCCIGADGSCEEQTKYCKEKDIEYFPVSSITSWGSQFMNSALNLHCTFVKRVFFLDFSKSWKWCRGI